MISRLAAVVGIALLFAGCATGTSSTWAKPGVGDAELARDRYTCTQESRVRDIPASESDRLFFYGNNKLAADEANRLFRLCMEARGWHL